MVKEYFINQDFEMIHISSPGRFQTNSEIFLSSGQGRVLIENEEILIALHQLFDHGYRTITKYSNAIRFVRWSNFRSGTGFIYFFGEQHQEALQEHFIVEIAPTSKDGWYFYISR